MKKKLLCLLLALTLSVCCGCAQRPAAEDGRLQVVCSLFPYYDFVRAIGGEHVSPSLLVPAGRETHSFEPTPLDVITVSRADVFIYNGGEGEYWVDGKCGLEEFFDLYDMEKEDENFESNTVGGWVTEKYGGIPPIGEIISFKQIEIKVVKATKQKVLKLRSRICEAAEEKEDD